MSDILVTGAAGFLGSNIADELSRRGHNVTLFDKIQSPYATSNQHMIVGDMDDCDLLLEITKNSQYVYHFAALADIDECSEKPREAVLTNILGTVNLLEACKQNNVTRFIFASSAYVLSNHGGFYKSSKRACENFILDYQEKYGLEYVILRFGSLYGHRSNDKNGVYRIVKALLNNNEFTYSGSGEEIRELINVIDAAKISADCLDEKYNNSKLLVTGIERFKMSDVIDMIKEIIGRDIKVNYSENTMANHYKITPYNYDLGYSYKIINNPYVDLGQGFVQVIHEILDNE